MHPQSVALSVLIDSGVRLSWPQAVALVQSIVAVGSTVPSRPRRPDLLDDLALDRDGGVFATSDEGVVLSVSELALLLGRLLPGDMAAARDRAPAGLQFAGSRALGLAAAPGFQSVEEFSRLLGRFEAGDRSQLLREVFEHYLVHTGRAQARYAEELHACAAPDLPGATSGLHEEPAETAATRPRVERRRSRITPDVARRLLRDADERHYRSRADGGAADTDESARAKASDRVRGDALPLDMLRRFLREADRATFESARRGDTAKEATGTAARGLTRMLLSPYLLLTYAGIAALAAIVVVGAIAEGYRRAPAIDALPGPSRVNRESVGLPAAPVPRTSTDDAPHRADTIQSARAAAAPRHATSQDVRHRSPRPSVKRPSAPSTVVREANNAADGGKRAPSIQANVPGRSAPVRLLGAVRRGFLRLFRRQPAAQQRDFTTTPAPQ